MGRVTSGQPRGEEAVYTDALRAGRIVFQVCRACNAPVWYLRTVCPVCMSSELVLTDSAGIGTVYSLTTLLRAGDPARAADVPYTVALIDLDEGVRVIGDLAPGAAAAGIGSRVAGVADESGISFSSVVS